MARTTKLEVYNMAEQVIIKLRNRGVDVEGWKIDYAPQYGGWCIETKHGSLGEAWMNANRMKSAEFVQAMRIARNVLELLEGK